MIRICPASFVPDPAAILPGIAEWVWEAGYPYISWLWGSEAAGKEQTAAWLRRESSELGLGKVTVLMAGEEVLGGYVAMGGAELMRARKSDLLEMLKVIKRASDSALLKRMGASRELFEAVADDYYYLSRIGVRRSYRGRGYGRQLLDHYLRTALEQGYELARLDVHSGNREAIALYRSYRFKVLKESASALAGMAYWAMIRDLHENASAAPDNP